MEGDKPSDDIVEQQAETPAEGADGAESSEQPLPTWANRLMAKVRGQASRSDKKLAQTTEALKAATKKLAELEGRSTAVQKKDAETNLRALRKAAAEANDWDKFEEYDSKLSQVRSIPTQAKEIPVPDVIADEMDSDDRDEFAAFAAATGSDGKPIRPWAVDGHKKYREAVNIGRSVFESDEFADAPIKDKLAEIDRRMAVLTGKAVHSSAAVLSGSGAPAGKAKTVAMSEQDKKLAKFWYGDSAKDDTEAFAKYRAAKDKTKGKYFGAVGNA